MATTTDTATMTVDAAAMLAAVEKARLNASKRGTLPVLAGVKITRDAVACTDLETTVSVAIQTGGDEVCGVVPATLLRDCLKKLSGEVLLAQRPGEVCSRCDGTGEHMEWVIDTDGNSVQKMTDCSRCHGSGTDETERRYTLTDGRRTYTLNGWPASDFPQTIGDDFSGDAETFPLETWRAMWRKVGPSVSKDDNRPILTAVHVTTDRERGRVRLEATDSYRLTRVERACVPQHEKLEALIPAAAFRLLEKPAIRKSGDAVTLTVGEHAATMQVGEVTVAARLIDGQYPNVDQLIPTDTYDAQGKSATLERETLLEAIEAVGVLAQKNAPHRITFNGKVIVSAKTQAVGEASETIDDAETSDFAGEELAFGVNGDYLADHLKVLDCDLVTLEVLTPLRPMRILDDDTTYIVMPIRLSDS